jgi:hypothetical protein
MAEHPLRSHDHVNIRRVLEHLEGVGIRFEASPNGLTHLSLSATTVLCLLEDPDAFWAAQLGVPVEQFRAYAGFTRQAPEALTCTGLNRDGSRCDTWIGDNVYGPPSSFVAGVTDRCSKHKVITTIS